MTTAIRNAPQLRFGEERLEDGTKATVSVTEPKK